MRDVEEAYAPRRKTLRATISKARLLFGSGGKERGKKSPEESARGHLEREEGTGLSIWNNLDGPSSVGQTVLGQKGIRRKEKRWNVAAAAEKEHVRCISRPKKRKRESHREKVRW